MTDEYDDDLAQIADQQAVIEHNEQVEAFIRRRKEAYMAVFGGKGSEADVEFVMRDLAHFCRAYVPTWNANPKVQDLMEGRREVFLRIMDHTRLSHDELFRKVTVEATNANRRK